MQSRYPIVLPVTLILIVYAIAVWHYSRKATSAEPAFAPEPASVVPAKSANAGTTPSSSHSGSVSAIGKSETNVPHFLKSDFLRASLAALEKNGSQLDRPMPSRHLIRSESREIAANVRQWAADHQFETTEPVIFRGHGGVEFFDVELIRTEVPDPDRIQQQGLSIRDGLGELEGAVYTTWVGEIIKD